MIRDELPVCQGGRGRRGMSTTAITRDLIVGHMRALKPSG